MITWTRLECEEDLEKARVKLADKGDVKFEMNADAYMLPNDPFLVKQLYLWLVQRQIVKLHEASKCVAGVEKQPGQAAHMNGGCLSEWCELVYTYSMKATGLVTVDEIVEYYIEFLKFAKENVPCNIYTIVQCMKEFMKDVGDELIDSTDRSGIYEPSILGMVFAQCYGRVKEAKRQNKEQ